MQLKGLLLSVCSGMFAVSSFAQQQSKAVVMQAPTRVIKTDTIVKSVGGGDQKKLLASNESPATPFKGVPLAGHRAYYGHMTEYVNGYVRQYLGAHNRTLSVVDERSTKRFSLIENVLTRYNIPKELKYLAVIESALNNKAISPVGAVGPWQLMSTTAQMMGLKVSSKNDDRTDWFKSTTAAAKYLNTLYKDLNDWLLVVAAYNSGPVPVNRAIQKTGSRNFWDIKKYLPRETQGHVLAFIATASIFENMRNFIGSGTLPDDFKFGEEDASAVAALVPPKPQFTEEELKSMAIVRISDPLNLELMAEELNIDKKLLKKWNHDYELFLYGTYSSEFYGLRIPKEKLEGFIEKKQMITRKSVDLLKAESI